MSTMEGVPAKKNILQRAWSGYSDGLGALVGYVARQYGRLGAYTARRPVLVLLVTIITSLIICVGWLRFRMETDSDVLWVPQTGKAHDDKAYVKSLFPQSKAGASFYAQLKPSQYVAFGGDNAIQRAVTWEMFQLHQKIMAITVAGDNGSPVTFMDLCYRNLNGSCSLDSGYLWYWYKDFDYYKQSINATDSPTSGNETTFRQQVQQPVYPDGGVVSLLTVFGGTTYNFNPMSIKTAQVIAADYTLDNSVSDETAKRWHDAFTDLMKAELPQQQYLTATWITGSTVGEELGKAINQDMFLVIISLIIFIIIGVMFLSKPSAVRTRTSLALLGVFVTALGICSGWGWGMIFGMPFTPLQQLSPFILVGMGLDVVFILVKSYEIIIQREPWLTLEQSFAKLMSTAGLSVQVTLLASAVAFALGSVDKLASVKWFSAFAALNTLMMMILMMTTFVAFMVLTERRIRAGRYDCLCCCVNEAAKFVPPPVPASNTVQAVYDTDGPVKPGQAFSSQDMSRDMSVTAGPVMISDDQVQDENMVKKFFRIYYGPVLSKWWVKVPVIIIFTTVAVLSWVSIYHIKYGQPLSDLAPDGSYLQDYDKVQEATYRYQTGEPMGLYFRDIDVSQPTEQYKMFKAWDMALQNEFANASTTALMGNWLVSFISWVNRTDPTALITLPPGFNCYNPLTGKVTGNLATVQTPTRVNIQWCVRQDRFYDMFRKWSAVFDNPNVICDRKCAAEGSQVVTSKFSVSLIPSAGDDKFAAHMMTSVRKLEKDISKQVFPAEDNTAGTYVSFFYGSNFVFYEGQEILPHQSLIYFMLALVGVGVVCTFMLVNPVASLLMMVAVGLVVLLLFGELWVFGIRFNQVSIINMIMATGLAVDYSVYFAQKFMTVIADGTGNGRMRAALTDTGSAVFLGGLTALCGTVPMAFSKSVIIRTFFRLIFGTVLFAMLVGLVLMPVVFSLIPLPPVKSALMDSLSSGMAVKEVGKSGRQSSSDDASDDVRIQVAAVKNQPPPVV